jgi:hypothetical protein
MDNITLKPEFDCSTLAWVVSFLLSLRRFILKYLIGTMDTS